MPIARAAVLDGPQQPFTFREVEVEEPRADEVLVRLVATGVCHTDVAAWAGAFPFPLPGVLGHEGAGVVERVGAAVVDVEPGNHVVLAFSSCGDCPACADGDPAYCADWRHRNLFAGARPDGTSALSADGDPLGAHFFGQSSFASHAVVRARDVVVVDDDVDLRLLAPLGCGVLTGFGSVWDVLDPAPGGRVAVVGTGAVGLAAVVAADLRDPEVLVAVDVVPERLALARELGATHTLHGTDDDVAAHLRGITGGRGLTAALDTTGVPAMIRTTLDALAPRGHLTTCAAPPPGTEVPVDVQGILTGKRLSGVTVGGANPRRLVPRVVDLVRSGVLPLDRLVRTYALTELDTALADMHLGRTVKPVVVH